MTLVLSWDLLLIVVVALIIAYSFIVGKEESVKIILSTYVAAVAIQGFGNIVEKGVGASSDFLTTVSMMPKVEWIAMLKLVLFSVAVVFLAIRAGFEIKYVKSVTGWQDSVLTGLIGFANASLLLATLVAFIAGRPILDPLLVTSPVLMPLMDQSTLVWALVHYQDLWFALPAFLLLGAGFLSR